MESHSTFHFLTKAVTFNRSNKADADKSSKTLETQPKSQLKTSKESTPASLLNPGGTPNAQEILKSIKIPDHLKYNQVEAQKYQMEQLRLKVSFS